MKNPYGLKDGTIVFVSDVPSGLDCECVCPACGHPLEARKGEINQHHFAHYRGSDCGVGYETALHIMSKEILEEKMQLYLPRLVVLADKALWKPGTPAKVLEIIPAGTTLRFDEVSLEQMVGGIIPDVVLRKGDRRLLAEITVTHGIDSTKLARIKELNISTVEFDFRRLNRLVTRDDLKRELLFNMSGFARWAFHTGAHEAQERANQEYIVASRPPPPLPPPLRRYPGGQKPLFGE
jgi:hypothetical protein